MTSERKKAILAMVLTFVVGIVIGSFIPGLIFRFGASNNRPPETRNMPAPQDRFERMINRMVDPDSIQKEKIKPLARETSVRIDSIQARTNRELKGVIDSLKIKLQPILNTEQLKKLDDFGNRPRGFDGSRGGRGGQDGRRGPDNGPDGQRGGFPDRPVGSSL